MRHERERTRGGRAWHGRSRFLLLGALALAALTLARPGGQAAAACSVSVSGISPAISFQPDTPAATITGSCFHNNGDITSVTFGSTAAAFSVTDDGHLAVTVPAGTTAGAVTVTASNGSSSGTTSYTYAPLPSATGITPALVFNDVGTAVTVSGSGFAPSTGTTALSINGGAVSTGTITNTSIAATAPAANLTGNVPVSAAVTLTGDTRSADVPGGLTYVAHPAVSGVVPSSGPEKGGTNVQISGSGLNPPAGATTTVNFGTHAAASVTPVSDTEIDAVSPSVPAATGTVDVTVTVTLPGGASETSATSTADQFTFVPAPIVTSVTPSTAPPGSNTDVTIGGQNFQDGAIVLFGPSDGSNGSPSNPFPNDLSATAVDVLGGTSILAITPAGPPGATNVVVINPDGQFGVLKSGDANHFAFTGSPPTLAATPISPTSGGTLGGTSVTITGAGFQSGATVTFIFPSPTSDPGARGTATSVNGAGTAITTTTPIHTAGAVNVVVTNPDGGSVTAASGFTFTNSAAPTIASPLSPATGSSTGGTQVTITGTGFAPGAAVTFGGTQAAFATVSGSTKIIVNTPAHAAGAADVFVTNPDGQNSNTLSGAFTYTAGPAPTLTGFAGGSATSGPTTGGTPVQLSGSGFVAGAHVTFGGTAGSSASVNGTGTLITVTTPPHAAGAVDVIVVNPDGQSSGTLSGGFTYTALAAISLTKLDVTTGSTLGNTAVKLTGAGFAPGASVVFGSTVAPAASTSVPSSTEIDTLTPAGVYGLVSVTVINPDDTSGSPDRATLANAFNFTPAPAPMIMSINPTSGAKGTVITITGTGFAFDNPAKLADGTADPYAGANSTGNAFVTIGGVALQPLPPVSPAIVSPPIIQSATTIKGVVPSLPGGPADITITNPDHQGVILKGAADANGPGFFYPTDTTPPATTATASAPPGYSFGTWTNKNVIVALNATDNPGGSGVKQITISAAPAGGGPGQTIPTSTTPVSSTTVNITVDGKTNLNFFATDNAGNVEDKTQPGNTVAIWLDKTPPVIATSATIPNGSGTQPYNFGQPTNQDVTVTFSCTDGGSGVNTLSFSTASSTTTSGTNPLAVTVNSPGSNQSVTATCTDVAGNSASSTFSGININKSAPVITASATAGGQPYTPGTWTDQAVTVTFSCTPIAGGTQIAFVTQPILINTEVHNDQVSGNCTDAAGNGATITFPPDPANGIDIDMTLPRASASATTTDNNGHTVPYTAGAWTNHDVVVTFSCQDQGAVQSGVPPVVTDEQAFLSPPVTVSAQGTTSSVTGNCSDAAGNEANPPAFFGPILIDKAPPVCSVVVNPNPIGPANGKLVSVVATVTVTDQSGLSGPNGFQLVSVASNNPATAGSDIVGFAPGSADTTGQLRATKGRSYTLTYKPFDVAGNVGATCSVQVTVK
ncbi:MAG TPA: IPT/TIG domain-containing protein [Dehalococcoidia bacterium]|nr:IPT/TIG domain-containing protein [Dehalococcoidia bacterium]